MTKYRCHTLKIPFYKATTVCLTIQQPRLKGKYRETLLVTKGWVNHELTLPREHHHLFMRCQTRWVKAGFSRCAAKEHFSDFFLLKRLYVYVTKEFLSSTSPLTLCCTFGLVPPADQSWRRYNRCPAGEVVPQHGLHSLPLRPAWGISE